MRNWPFQIGFIVVVVILAVVYWQFLRDPAPEVAVAPLPPAVISVEKPAIRHQVTTAPAELPAAAPLIDPDQLLPELPQSDETMVAILGKLFTEQQLERFFFREHIIERFVVMVDNLPRCTLPATHRPLKKIPGGFLVNGERPRLTLDPANYRRYLPLLELLVALDQERMVAVYQRLYPLFQEAYEELGYPEGYFNDRLIEVVDHLLATPKVADPILLLQPKALYLYADPALEEFSAGRKILLRSGPENATRIKQLLREYRARLIE